MQQDMLKMGTEWSIMKNEWDDVKVSQARQGRKIDKILDLLNNDNETGDVGIVHDVRANTKFRDTALTKMKVYATVGSTIVATGITLLIKYFLR